MPLSRLLLERFLIGTVSVSNLYQDDLENEGQKDDVK